MDEQRPQRQGYADLNERQSEGIPALEADEKAGSGPNFPDLGDQAQGETNLVQKAVTNEGRLDDSTGSGQAEPAAGVGLADTISGGEDRGGAMSDYANAGGSGNPDIDRDLGDASDLSDEVDEGGATSGGQRSGGDGGERSITGG